MRLETALAKGSLDRVSRRDPEKVYHTMTKQELEGLGSGFQWKHTSATRVRLTFEKCQRCLAGLH